jgi:hypothetical protein
MVQIFVTEDNSNLSEIHLVDLTEYFIYIYIYIIVDLQLDVKGCRDVYASFDKYVEVERLEGDNKYHAEQHGLQVRCF